MFDDLLVHVDATKQGERRIAAAARFARALAARLTGLYVVAPEAGLVSAGAVPVTAAAAQAAANLHNPMRDALEATEERFEEICGYVGAKSRWLATEGPTPPLVSAHARFHDLAIVGQDAEGADPLLPPLGLATDVAGESGRPVLVIPNVGDWDRIGTRVTVAWNASRESARALHDALPLLARASDVRVVTVAEAGAGEGSASSHLDVVEHLQRHGVEATWWRDPTDLAVADEILARMGDQACDLLVMGAREHSRLRELVFGGTTREILAHMTAPVLLSC